MLAAPPPVRTSRPRAPLVVTLMYLFVLQAAPYLHHDWQCHQASRSHCTSCLLNVGASDVSNDLGPCVRSLLPAEALTGSPAPAVTLVPIVFGSDSSPPA